MKFFFLLIYIYLIIHGANQLAVAENFSPVFNDGLSKMEMIEKMDTYLAKELPEVLRKHDSSLQSTRDEFDQKLNTLKESLTNIEKNLAQVQETLANMSTKKGGDAVSEENALYLEDLKKEIIPAIQKKMMDNNLEFREFVKTLMAERAVTKKISKELENTKK